MSMQESGPQGRPMSGASGHRDYPVCPQCNRRMTVKQVTPMMSASATDEIVYGCSDCGTAVIEAVRRG